MRSLLAKFALLLVLGCSGLSAADVHVRGYTRSDGTYVQPHYRTAPDSTKSNNYSTYPNVNPYTGQTGTKHISDYSSTSSSTSTYQKPFVATYNYEYSTRPATSGGK